MLAARKPQRVCRCRESSRNLTNRAAYLKPVVIAAINTIGKAGGAVNCNAFDDQRQRSGTGREILRRRLRPARLKLRGRARDKACRIPIVSKRAAGIALPKFYCKLT